MVRITRRDLLISAMAWATVQKFAFAQSGGSGDTRSIAVAAKLPKSSDVIFSTRSFYANSVDMLKAFGANRCEWVYTDDQAFVNKLKAAVPHVGLGLSSTGHSADASASASEIGGKPLVAPWMQRMGMTWKSSIRKPARDALLQWSQKDVSLGADSIQLDDPNMEYGAVMFAGGDFSPEAVSGFSSFAKKDNAISPEVAADLAKVDWDIGRWVYSKGGGPNINWTLFKALHAQDPTWQAWRQFLRLTTSTFLDSLRQTLHSGSRAIPLSFNVSDPFPIENNSFLLERADYLISEISKGSSPARIGLYCGTANAFGIPLVASLYPDSVGINRWQIACTYANGGLALVPWDVFVAGNGGSNPRYFGKPEEYGDLFAFVRQNQALFDGWDLAADAVIFAKAIALDPVVLERAAVTLIGMGLTFKMVVQQPTGSVFGMQQFTRPPAVAISLGVSDQDMRKSFSNSQIVTAGNLNGAHDYAANALVARPSNPQRFHVVVKKNSAMELLLHVIDKSSSGRRSNSDEHIELRIPAAYTTGKNFSGAAVLFSPGAAPENVQIKMSAGTPTILTIPFRSTKEWAILKIVYK